MLRLLLKAAAALLVLLATVAGGLYGMRQLAHAEFKRGLAAAEAWNATHWETGSALRLRARLTARVDGETTTRDTAFDCYQMRQVDGRLYWRPTTSLVTLPVGLKSIFTIHTKDRSIYFGPGRQVCAEMFQNAGLTDTSAPFNGEVIINPIPDEDASDVELRLARFRSTCSLNWSAERPLTLGNGVQIEKLDVLSVESVPLRSVLTAPDHMGSADETVAKLANQITSTVNLEDPTLYRWNTSDLCWKSPLDGVCKASVDNLCGIPRL